MEIIQQENTQEVQQENTQEVQQENLFGNNNSQSTPETANVQKIIQLVPPKEVFDKIAEIERRYRETVERENI